MTLEKLERNTEQIFTILKKELEFSEKHNFCEKIISSIKHIDKYIPYKIIIDNINKIHFINIGLLLSIFWHFNHTYGKYIKQNLNIPKEIINSASLELFVIIVLFVFFPLLFLIHLIAVILSEQRNSEDILTNIKKRMDYLLIDENLNVLSEGSSITYNKLYNSKQIDFFVLDSLKSHFEYLLKQGEKNKERASSIIPILAAIAVLISYYIIGIPKEMINALKRSSEYESIAILTGFLIIIYVAMIQFSHSRLSIKYLKCISTIEKLKSLSSLNAEKTE
jgi:hypothetical protein